MKAPGPGAEAKANHGGTETRRDPPHSSSAPPCLRGESSSFLEPDRVPSRSGLFLFFLLLTLSPRATAQQEIQKKEKLDLKALFQKGIPESPFIAVVYRYADTMLQHGRDTHGPQHTRLFLSALDRETLSPLDIRPTAPAGVPPGRRPGRPGQALRGADPQLDQNLLRLLYFLKGLSGQDRYPKAADAGLKWFLQNAQSDSTGLYPWGEHHSWNTFEDEADGAPAFAHEFVRPWMLWEKCFELAPGPCERFARSLRDHELSPETTGREPDPRQAGFRIRTWAEAHAQTGDPSFTRAIDDLLDRLERRPRSGPASSFLSLAIDCDGAARSVPEPLRTRLTRHAVREDEVFCALPHALETSGGFVLDSAGEAEGARTHSPRWDPRHRGETTASIAMMCVSRYENTGQTGYRDRIVAAADSYLDSLPGAEIDAWPMTFGHVIALDLSAFRITADPKYFLKAFELGEVAVKEFFGGAPLPRASLKTKHYESTTGADTLVLALTELHLTTRTITAVRAPVNTIDR